MNVDGTVKYHRKISARSGNLLIGPQCVLLSSLSGRARCCGGVWLAPYTHASVCLLHSIHVARPGDRFGASISLLGDCNRDGNPEIAVGSPLAAASGQQVGRVYILELLPCTCVWA